MSRVQIESKKQRQRRRQERHVKRHPKFPAQQRKLNPKRTIAKAKASAVPTAQLPVERRPMRANVPVGVQAATTVSSQIAADLALPIEELDLPLLPYNVLKREGVNTVGELVGKTEKDLLDMYQMGQRSVDNHIKPKLAGMGLSLKQA